MTGEGNVCCTLISFSCQVPFSRCTLPDFSTILLPGRSVILYNQNLLRSCCPPPLFIPHSTHATHRTSSASCLYKLDHNKSAFRNHPAANHCLYMATKMDLDFLLAPNSNAMVTTSSTEGCPSRGESSSAGRDYAAPSHSTNHRRMAVQSSRSRVPNGSSSKGASHKDVKTSSSKSLSKTKKSKSPSSPSTQKTPSSEARPHECRQCGRAFYKQEQLKRHIRLVHENWRPFKCLFCEIQFGTKQNMQVHFSTRKHRHRVATLQATNPEAAREARNHHQH